MISRLKQYSFNKCRALQKGFFLTFVACTLLPFVEARSYDRDISKIQNEVTDWSEGFSVPAGGRPNPYSLSDENYLIAVDAGKIHAQIYPVTVSELIPPYYPIVHLLEADSANPLQIIMRNLFVAFTGKTNLREVLDWIGLHKYPSFSDSGVYAVPIPSNQPIPQRLGFGLIEKNGATGFSISCAACHSGNLFGKTVLGMTNRFPRANHAFLSIQRLMPFVSPTFFKIFSLATNAETKLLRQARNSMRSLGVKEPLLLGLDTSLSQVALSLAKRNPDSWASKNPYFEAHPRYDPLQEIPADSKPAVWWNLKYKNRWLSDGSVVSGNPVFTNILWNEIGRGTDLKELDQWLTENENIVKELTTAVFSIEPPRFTDFFQAEKIDLASARRGEELFNQNCFNCHGQYQKVWSQEGSANLPLAQQLKTRQVIYKEKTPVINVSTDPLRASGMSSLEQLNHLTISINNQAVIKVQKGYVPPPLVGIWARWPYLHNNSVPDLCSMLTASQFRPQSYFAGEAKSKSVDFDADCNGYPLGEKTPTTWKTKKNFYDTRRLGMSNSGHDEGIVSDNGIDRYSPSQKRDLIQFLQTL